MTIGSPAGTVAGRTTSNELHVVARLSDGRSIRHHLQLSVVPEIDDLFPDRTARRTRPSKLENSHRAAALPSSAGRSSGALRSHWLSYSGLKPRRDLTSAL